MKVVCDTRRQKCTYVYATNLKLETETERYIIKQETSTNNVKRLVVKLQSGDT